MHQKNLRICFGLMVTALFFLTTACQTLKTCPPDEILAKRAAEMMTARENQDWAKVYRYLDPEYRKGISKSSFVAMDRNLLYADGVVESVEIAESGKEARVKVKYTMVVTSFGVEVPDHVETQTWVKVGRRWYYQMKSDSPMG